MDKKMKMKKQSMNLMIHSCEGLKLMTNGQLIFSKVSILRVVYLNIIYSLKDKFLIHSNSSYSKR